jgi:ribosomal protein S18 acetylase RimI-like enzyme
VSEAVVKVREAVVPDAAAIAHLHVLAWQRAFRQMIPDEVLDALSEEKRAARSVAEIKSVDNTVLVATLEGRVIGFCLVRRSNDADAPHDTAEIAALYVHPDVWRRGAGRALIDATLSLVQRQQFRRLTLWVLVSNAAARAFYKQVGFEADGASKLEQRSGYALSELRYVRCL